MRPLSLSPLSMRPLSLLCSAAIACGALQLTACNAKDLVEATPPQTVVNPEVLETSRGAMLIYNGTVDQSVRTFDQYVGSFALFTDETQLMGVNQATQTDKRTLLLEVRLGGSSPPTDFTFANLSGNRIAIEQGIGALQKYAPLAPKSLTGELFAFRGLTEVLMGEGYCSGVPLSDAPYGSDIVFGSSLTTTQLYEHALAQFDSALVYAVDSARILNFARVGRGRALLDLARFTEAAAAVQDVPTTFKYEVKFDGVLLNNTLGNPGNTSYSVSDEEGSNGLNFVTANDSRVRTQGSGARVVPLKYPAITAPMVLADGVEARLIEAEVALKANDVATWTAKLNALRATAITPAMPALTADSTTTASAARRLDVMFRERAFWLFLTGHRMGDLRRLVRQYQRPQENVFPVGPYHLGEEYGNAVDVPPTLGELTGNPNYHGCINREA